MIQKRKIDMHSRGVSLKKRSNKRRKVLKK
jgi:hypothetical protein